MLCHVTDEELWPLLEEQFHDLFVTAGYASAFGAALGAAALSFKSHPEQHLRYVAVGASLGFIGGSFLGTYIIFSPLFTENSAQTSPLKLASIGKTIAPITVRPYVNAKTKTFKGVESVFTIAQF